MKRRQEPSLGLAPVMFDVTFEKIKEIHKMGTAILLVEQNVSRALGLVQRAYVLESGKVIMHGTTELRRWPWWSFYTRLFRRGGSNEC